MADGLRTRIDRQGRLYVPKTAGAVTARWNRVGNVVYVMLTDAPGREYRRYIQLIPSSLLAASLRNRWRRIRLTLTRVRGGWLGWYKLLERRSDAEKGRR